MKYGHADDTNGNNSVSFYYSIDQYDFNYDKYEISSQSDYWMVQNDPDSEKDISSNDDSDKFDEVAYPTRTTEIKGIISSTEPMTRLTQRPAGVKVL